MKRRPAGITVGVIREELQEELKSAFKPEGENLPSRSSFYRLAKRLDFPEPVRDDSHIETRRWTREQAEEIKYKIKQYLNLLG